ncbi:ribokinase [Microbacterium invictum]|uniref:Ribokinase n=1 Tax=Microbacterium invictum TaxID=515415 RepID=A0AA40SLF6_9MICO|nr:MULTISPECIES: ribokinase [Microbacterium]MBB4138400.1 ribokinase [Microbacterium invictum]
MATARVLVFGSINADTTLRVERIPLVGETVVAHDVQYASGGKGANQAYAAACTRPGVAVLMAGAIGDDARGAQMRDELAAAGVDVSLIREVDGPSGTALITVDADGGNVIVVAPGANHRWETRPEVPVTAGDVVVLQLELPLDIVEHVARTAHAAGARVVLNAAPATPGAERLLPLVDCLVVNEPEATALLAQVDVELPVLGARLDLDIVITRGADGASVLRRGDAEVRLPAFPAEAVDTVGAGDAFVGALAAALAAGDDLLAAARRGAAAGALTVSVAGARHPQLSGDLVDDRLNQR